MLSVNYHHILAYSVCDFFYTFYFLHKIHYIKNVNFHETKNQLLAKELMEINEIQIKENKLHLC